MDSTLLFNRSELLLGPEAMTRLANAHVAVFGVGGVGSWTAEALVRTGLRHLTIVDADVVAPTNINRQLMATTETIGQPKCDALRRRLLAINPDACITAIGKRFCDATTNDFNLQSFDYIVDAIDSLSDKALLISTATRLKIKIFSSMGAACKIDPTRIRVDNFEKVNGCRLAAALRRKFKQSGSFPSRKFKCVYSDEHSPNLGKPAEIDTAMTYGKAITNGALCHITAIFGLTLAGLIIADIRKRSE